MYCAFYTLHLTLWYIWWHLYILAQLPDGRGGKTCECLTPVAKAALTLSHSSAIPERGFFVSIAMLGKEKLSLGENTIVALHIVKNTISLFGSVTGVPITKDLTAVRKAHSELYLEDQRRQKAADIKHT